MKDAGRGKKFRKHMHQKKQIAKECVYGSISSKMEAESAVRGVRNSKTTREKNEKSIVRVPWNFRGFPENPQNFLDSTMKTVTDGKRLTNGKRVGMGVQPNFGSK